MLKDNIAKRLHSIENIFKIRIFSQKCGIDENSLAKILNGTTKNPSIHTVTKIADALNCSVDELLEERRSNCDQKELKLKSPKNSVIAIKESLAKRISAMGSGFKKSAFVVKVGITEEALSHILTGKVKNPRVYTVAKMAKVLGCSVDELIGRDTAKNPSSSVATKK